MALIKGSVEESLGTTSERHPEEADLFEYPMAHVPLVYLFTICGIGAGLGQWVFKLESSSFRDLARLEVAAERLEHQLRGRGEIRAELARQLHDDMAQLITGARLQLDGLARREPTRGAPVDRLTSLLDELSVNAHRMLEQLRQPRSLGTLRDELARLQLEFRALSMAVDLVVDEAWITSPGRDEAEAVLAIAREALTNAVRHARASEATVSLQQHQGELTLLIMDNGGGKAATLREGHGLRGIRERARLLEAALAAVTTRAVDLALVDVQLKVPTTAARLRPLCEHCRVVLFSARHLDTQVRSLLAAGAVAFADKALPLDELDQLLRRIHAGERPGNPESRPASPLSAREDQVYRALAGGSSPKEVAGQLGLATSPVYCHLENVKKKLGLHSLQALVVHAAQNHES